MKIRTDFVTNSSSVSFIVSVDRKMLSDFLSAIPKGEWGDDENVVYKVCVTPEELSESVCDDWSKEAMVTARRALKHGDAVVYFSLANLFLETQPERVDRIFDLCAEIDSESQ